MRKSLHIAQCNSNKRRKFHFNLVEVTLAMGILAFGMTGIFSMCMAGMKNTRDTIGDTYAIMLAEYMFGALQTHAGGARYFGSTDKGDMIYVEDESGGGSTGQKIIEGAGISTLENSLPNSDLKASTLADGNKEYDFSVLGGGSQSKTGAWRCSVRTKTITDEGVIAPGKKSDERVDFSADVRVWLAGHGDFTSGVGVAYMYPYVNESGNNVFRKDFVLWDWFAKSDPDLKDINMTSSPQSHTGVYVEVSWPTDRDLIGKNGKIQRNRRVFYREIYK